MGYVARRSAMRKLNTIALLDAVGIGLGLAIGHAGKIYSQRTVQVGGGAMAIAGVAILAGL
jgi:urease accessory protein